MTNLVAQMFAICGSVPRLYAVCRYSQAAPRDLDRAFLLRQLQPEDHGPGRRIASDRSRQGGDNGGHTAEHRIGCRIPRRGAETVQAAPAVRVTTLVFGESGNGIAQLPVFPFLERAQRHRQETALQTQDQLVREHAGQLVVAAPMRLVELAIDARIGERCERLTEEPARRIDWS